MATPIDRISRVEDILEQMNERLGNLESQVARILDPKADKSEVCLLSNCDYYDLADRRYRPAWRGYSQDLAPTTEVHPTYETHPAGHQDAAV